MNESHKNKFIPELYVQFNAIQNEINAEQVAIFKGFVKSNIGKLKDLHINVYTKGQIQEVGAYFETPNKSWDFNVKDPGKGFSTENRINGQIDLGAEEKLDFELKVIPSYPANKVCVLPSAAVYDLNQDRVYRTNGVEEICIDIIQPSKAGPVVALLSKE